MPIARLDKVSLSFGLKPLLDHVVLQIRKGERVCLLGRNGEGKSSLLQVIAREIVPDSGEVWIRPGARVASLAQEVRRPSERHGARGDQAGRRVRRRGTATGKPSCRSIRSSRGCSSIAMRRCASLSGGWRRRVMLGRALVVGARSAVAG